MAQRRDVYRRRRLAALGVVAAASALAGAIVGSGAGDDGSASSDSTASAAAKRTTSRPARPAQLPLGGRTIFPHYRVIAYYGAPQSHELGALGIGSPDAAGRRLRRQAAPYARKTRPVMLAFELIASVANSDPGEDGLYRTRQTDAVVRRYLNAARRRQALLLLDIQPGHADFVDEVRHFDRWLREPDVGLALDPEWHTPGAQPGTVIGAVDAATVNQISAHLAAIVRAGNLPEKLFVVHQFTHDMIRGKAQVMHRPGVATTMNVDGFGDRANKVAKYREFTHDGTHFHRGYKLFYEEDVGLMSPRSVLALRPPPDFVVYE
jgi:hypothetical protein